MTCFNCADAEATVRVGDIWVCDGCAFTSWLQTDPHALDDEPERGES